MALSAERLRQIVAEVGGDDYDNGEELPDLRGGLDPTDDEQGNGPNDAVVGGALSRYRRWQ